MSACLRNPTEAYSDTLHDPLETTGHLHPILYLAAVLYLVSAAAVGRVPVVE